MSSWDKKLKNWPKIAPNADFSDLSKKTLDRVATMMPAKSKIKVSDDQLFAAIAPESDDERKSRATTSAPVNPETFSKKTMRSERTGKP